MDTAPQDLEEVKEVSIEENVPVEGIAEVKPNSTSWQRPAIVLAALIALVAMGAAGYFFGTMSSSGDKQMPIASPEPTDAGVACTLDAKICPDGSSIGRVGPNCEFSPCPSDGDELSMADWRMVRSETCGVSMKIPPETFGIQNPSPMDSGRVWMFSEVALDSTGYLPFTHMVNANYAVPEGLGSGYAAGSVTVECAQNSKNMTTQQLFEELKAKVASVSSDPDEFSYVERGEAMISGNTAIKYEGKGGQAIEGHYFYVFATSDMLYRVNSISMSENTKVQETTQQIFNSITVE